MGAFPEGRPEGSAGSGVRLGTLRDERELWLLDRGGRGGGHLVSFDPRSGMALPLQEEDLAGFGAEASAWYRLGTRRHVAGLGLPAGVRQALARAARRTLPGDLASTGVAAGMFLLPPVLVSAWLARGGGTEAGTLSVVLAVASWAAWSMATLLSPSSDIPGRLLCMVRLPRRADAGGTPVPNAGWAALFADGLFQLRFLAAFSGGMAVAYVVGRSLGDDTSSLLAAGGTGIFAFLLLLLVLGVLGGRLKLVRRLGDFLDRVRPDGKGA